MSFTTNKPTGDNGQQPAGRLRLPLRNATSAVFKPQLVRSVRMHWLVAGCVAAVTLIALLGYATFQKSTYIAISRVYEEPVSAGLLSDSGAAFDANKYEMFLGEQIQSVQRLDVLKAGLATLPTTTWLEYGSTGQAAAEQIQAQLKVQRVATSYQMSISLKGADPAKTAQVVNSITDSYIATVQKSAAEEFDQQARLLTEERQRTETELRAASLEQQITRATNVAPRLQRAAELAADMQRLEARVATIDDVMRTLRLKSVGPGQVRLSLAATAPEKPEEDRKKLLLIIALPLALLFGAAAAVLARNRDRRIYGGVDIEDLVGFAPMAELPARADVSDRVYGEYVLRLAAAIETAYRINGARTFLVTAVSPTTEIQPLANALTRKFEEIGVNMIVATVDAMLAPAGSLPIAVGHGSSPAGLAQMVEVWSGGFVAANVARLKSEHGLVLIEAEALLNWAKTEYVAQCVDGTILVVECGVTTREELYRAVELLQRLQVTGIGAVLEEIQLRLADGSFRTSIEVLSRRQLEMAPQETKPPVVMATPVQVAEEMERSVVASMQEQPSGVFHQPINLLNMEHEIDGRLGDEGYRSTLDQFRSTVMNDQEHEMAWESPSVAKSALKSDVAATPTSYKTAVTTPTSIPSSYVSASTQATPVKAAVSALPVQPVKERELEKKFPTAPGLEVPVAVEREKIVPTLSAQQMILPADGDASMSRKTSWLDRLMGRSDETSFRIVPVDEKDDAVEANAAPEPSPAFTRELQPSLIRSGATTNPEDYEKPLASRIEQISRHHSIATSPVVAMVPKPEVVPERIDSLVSIALTESVAVVHEIAEPPPPAHFGMHPAIFPAIEPIVVTRIAVTPVGEAKEETSSPALEALVVHGVQPAIPKIARPASQLSMTSETAPLHSEVAPIPSRRLRRPLSFQQLQELELHRDSGRSVLPSISDQSIGQAVASSQATIPDLPSDIAAVDVPAAIEMVANAAVSQEDLLRRLQPAAPEPVQILDEWSEIAASSTRFHDAFGGTGEVSPQYAFDDTDPVFQEATRNLTAGRWDPIPQLRPSIISWRDRGTSKDSDLSERNRWTGSDAVQAQEPDNAWGPDSMVEQAHQTEPLPEPLLTRQWGLLSRFQQQRISSSRPVATNTDEVPAVAAPPGTRKS